jgi:ABC-type branched-subunit amino acid transport system substrate-binding protein/TolA-binding protein
VTLPRKVAIASLGLALFSWSCATRTGPYRPQVESEYEKVDPMAGAPAPEREEKAYQEILQLYSKGATEGALMKIQSFDKSFPQSRKRPAIDNVRGLISLRKKQPIQAIQAFERAIAMPSEPPFRDYVLYNLASAQYDAHLHTNAQRSLEKIEANRLNTSTRMKYFLLSAANAEKQDQPYETTRALLRSSYLWDSSAGNLSGGGEAASGKSALEERLERALQKINDADALRSLYQEFESSPMVDRILYRLGKVSLAAGKASQAEGFFTTLISKYPQSPMYVDATDALRGLQSQSAADAKAVGVLLPMSGKFARFGRQTLNSLTLAFRVFEPREPESAIELIVEDSGDTPEQAVQALERLYKEHHVIAVIGPILSRGIEAVSQRAEELAVPLISLAESTPTKGGFVFQASLSVKNQASEIARYAVQKLGLKKFAILHPQRKQGQDYMHAFWDAVEELGGEIVDVESYSGKTEEFTEVVDRMAGLFYQDARKRELDALAKLRTDMKITRRTRQNEQYFKLEPIVNFQAVFIPDDAATVARLLRYFPYRDIDGMQFLGISTWNSPTLLEKTDRFSEGAAFVDAFGFQNTSLIARKFQSRFESVFEARARGPDALAFDAALLLETAILRTGASANRFQIRDALAQMREFPGVTGKITYKDGAFERPMRVFTVRKGEFAESAL